MKMGKNWLRKYKNLEKKFYKKWKKIWKIFNGFWAVLRFTFCNYINTYLLLNINYLVFTFHIMIVVLNYVLSYYITYLITY